MNLYDVAYTQCGRVMRSAQQWDWCTSQVSRLESRSRENVSSLFSCKSFTDGPAHILQCYSKASLNWVQFEHASCTTARPGTVGFCCARTRNANLGSCMNVTYPTSCVKCLILLFDFKEIWSLWTFSVEVHMSIFAEILTQWEPSCSMRTDIYDEANSRFSLFYESA